MFNPGNAYLVDILHSRSAEVTAANMWVFSPFLGGFNLTFRTRAARNLVVALSVGLILPSLNVFGLLTTFIGSALIAWIGFG